jgi:hypothetical protein
MKNSYINESFNQRCTYKNIKEPPDYRRSNTKGDTRTKTRSKPSHDESLNEMIINI